MVDSLAHANALVSGERTKFAYITNAMTQLPEIANHSVGLSDDRHRRETPRPSS